MAPNYGSSITKHVSIESGRGAAAEESDDETTPLVSAAQNNGNNGQTQGSSRHTTRNTIRHVIVPILIGFLVLSMGMIVAVLHHHDTQHARAYAAAAPLRAMVHTNELGQYVVTYPQNLTTTKTTKTRTTTKTNSNHADLTLAELAQLMVPVWFEASIMALATFNATVKPSQVHWARKCMLTTRDLLDVFAPVYSTTKTKNGNVNHLWSDLRRMYKQGYELAGTYQDLYVGHIKHAKALRHKRRDDLLVWKAEFEKFERWHGNIRYFLAHPNPTGCVSASEESKSHLFWGDYFSTAAANNSRDGTHSLLPCGDDLVTPVLQKLAVIQLTHAMTYLHKIMQYDDVLSRGHQLVYHNFRKTLRSFVDEYDLFGFILFPQIGPNELDAIDTLIHARLLLGELNDHWEAFNLYREKSADNSTSSSPSDKVLQLEANILQEWEHFKAWSQTSNLSFVIQSLIDKLSPNKLEY